MVKAKKSSAGATARTTGTCSGLKHTFLIAAGAVRDGQNWQDDTVFNSEVITKLFGSSKWWQEQIDLTQLAIVTLQDQLTGHSKLLSDDMIAGNRDKVDITTSMVDCTKDQLAVYKEWENICFGQLQKLANVRPRKRSAPPAYLKDGGLPP